MGIIKLNCVFSCKEAEITAVLCLIAANNILKRSRAEEILLLQAKYFALIFVVVRIKNLSNVFCVVLLLNSLVIFCIIESRKVKIFKSLCLPQTKGVDVLGLAADNSHVVGDCPYGLILERNGNSLVLLAQTPGIFKSLPVVGGLYLIAVLDKLLEESVFVADTVAVERNLLGSRGIKIASRKSSQAAVAQSRVVDLLKHVDVNALFLEELCDIFENSEAVEVVVHHSAHEELSREIVSSALAVVFCLALCPVGSDLSHNRLAQAEVQL